MCSITFETNVFYFYVCFKLYLKTILQKTIVKLQSETFSSRKYQILLTFL